MDMTGAFAVIGALALVVFAAIAISTISVLAWIGMKRVHELWRDEQRTARKIDEAADRYFAGPR
jgi:hypothetical protein